MSWLRLEPQQGTYQGKRQYEGLCETQADMAQAEADGYAEFDGSKVEIAQGTLCFCAETRAVHGLMSDGHFAQLTKGQEAGT